MHALTAAMLVLCAGGAWAGENPDEGRVVALQGSVLVYPPGGGPGRALKLADAVTADGTVLETASDAKVKIVFGKSVLTLDGGTRVELMRYHYTRERNVLEAIIGVTRGLIRSRVDTPLGAGSLYEHRMFNTIAGVKGTDFATRTDGRESSDVYVFEGGPVSVRPSGGGEELLGANEMARVDKSGTAKVSALPADVREKACVTLEPVRRSRVPAAPPAGRGAAPDAQGAGRSGALGMSSPQEVVTGAQFVNPGNLSVPPAPSSGSAPVPALRHPPAPLSGGGKEGGRIRRPDGVPF